MHHRLSNFKRTIAESTYNSQTKFSKSVNCVRKMIDESKVTLRSSEPYIGGEKETGSRINRYRNKSREDTSIINSSNLKVFMPKRLDTFEDTRPAKITTRETKTRPVSAFIKSNPQKVRIR
jgi:hypothetical protein